MKRIDLVDDLVRDINPIICFFFIYFSKKKVYAECTLLNSLTVEITKLVLFFVIGKKKKEKKKKYVFY